MMAGGKVETMAVVKADTTVEHSAVLMAVLMVAPKDQWMVALKVAKTVV